MPPGNAVLDPGENPKALLAYGILALRGSRGMSQDDLAKALHVSRETISAYETGRVPPPPEFCAAVDEFFGTGELMANLRKNASKAHLRQWNEDFFVHELESNQIRTYEPLYVPGLLQTEGYIRASGTLGEPNEEKIVRRLARSTRLTGAGAPHFFGVVDEAVIARPVGGAATMCEQLAHMLEVSEHPHVHLQVVPFAHGYYEGLTGALVSMAKPDLTKVGYVEAQIGGRLIEDQAEAARLILVFDEIRGAALPENASRALIRKRMETMHDDRLA
ncbi:helix-turn-helix domain-containing protein [Actinomadura flavalba]|uniref:helix-turn-helix domain-containing protein n=1 Tax=Actinomadura flavalba TaxID=1120938 RepID=UPI000375DCD9|nr:helix-turn-helix transcriptional regulator [Actinomadura flavalba]